MLSIADVEKQLAAEAAEKQKIADEAKAKVAASKNNATANADASNAAQQKTEGKRAEAKSCLNQIQELGDKINDLKKLKTLPEQADKELKKLEELRSQTFQKWSDNMQSIKGIEKTITSLTQGDVMENIHKLSEQLLSKRLEEDMQKELNNLKSLGKITEEKFIQMRAVIRGHKTITITQAPMITEAVSQVDKYLKDYVDKQAKDIIGKVNIGDSLKKATGSINSIFTQEKKVYGGLKKISEKLKSFEAMSKDDAALAITKTLSSNLGKYTNLDKFFKSIDSDMKNKLGQTIDSKKLLSPVLGKINTNVGAKISAKLQPIIKNHVKVIEKITTKVAKLQARIVAAEKAFKEAVQKFQDMANNFIKDQTKQLADKISSELGINLGSALGGLGGSIKLGF